MRMNFLLKYSAISLGAALIMSAPAKAESVIATGNPQPSVTVSSPDLDLDSRAGVARLKIRVEAAGSNLCLTYAVEPIAIRMARARCFRAAVSSGHQQVERMVAAQVAKSKKMAAATLFDAARRRSKAD